MDLDVKDADRSRYEDRIDQDSRVRLVWYYFIIDMVSRN
jgi:hypothetical protein